LFFGLGATGESSHQWLTRNYTGDQSVTSGTRNVSRDAALEITQNLATLSGHKANQGGVADVLA
jgi:hypothetical protein